MWTFARCIVKGERGVAYLCTCECFISFPVELVDDFLQSRAWAGIQPLLRVGIVERDEEKREGRGSGQAAVRREVDLGEDVFVAVPEVRDAEFFRVSLVVQVPPKDDAAVSEACKVPAARRVRSGVMGLSRGGIRRD